MRKNSSGAFVGKWPDEFYSDFIIDAERGSSKLWSERS